MTHPLPGEPPTKQCDRVAAQDPALVFELHTQGATPRVTPCTPSVMQPQVHRKMAHWHTDRFATLLALEKSGIDLGDYQRRRFGHRPIRPPSSLHLFAQLCAVKLHTLPDQPCAHTHPRPAKKLRRCWSIIAPGGCFQSTSLHQRRKQPRRLWLKERLT